MNFLNDDIKKAIIALSIFTLGYLLGNSAGVYKGENTGLRAQDSKSITTLGATVATLDRELKIANRVMSAVAKKDTTGEYERFMNQAIKQLRDKK